MYKSLRFENKSWNSNVWDSKINNFWRLDNILLLHFTPSYCFPVLRYIYNVPNKHFHELMASLMVLLECNVNSLPSLKTVLLSGQT